MRMFRCLARNKIHSFRNLSVADFATLRSLYLFEALHLPQEFLTVAIDSWIERIDYKPACKIIYALRVVNDCAESAVKLATDFNKVVTKDDQQCQLLYQIVEH